MHAAEKTCLVLLFTAALVIPCDAQITELERQRLAAHLEMTRAWLLDEVAHLTPAQLAFRPEPHAWSIMEVLDHLVVVGPIYWDDLQRAVKSPPPKRAPLSRDEDILWYGVDRTNREAAIPSEMPKQEVRDLGAALRAYEAAHARLLQYVRTTEHDLRRRAVERQGCDAYQWALLISAHEQRHILQIREIKAHAAFPRP
jgi:uncharacterized damage-inducible protein DinB